MYPNPSPTPTPPTPPLALHQIIDYQQGGGMAAVVFRHPAHWQAQSQMVWDLQKHSMPLKTFARTTDPATGEMVEFFPIEGFYWIEPNLGFSQPGQENGGMTLMPPMSAADAMIRWVIPRYRTQGVTNLRVVQVQPLDPRLLRPAGTAVPQGAMEEGVCVRVEFTANGRVFEEEFYGLKTAYQGIPSYGAAGMLTQYNWGFDRLFSFHAPQGRLDALRETGWRVVHSVKINPRWEQLYAQIMQQVQNQFNQHLQAGYQNIADATRLCHQISADNDAWLHQQQQNRDAAYQSDYNRRHAAAQDTAYTTTDAFGDMMMGRDTYDDPYHTQTGSQHGYHDQVWTDGQGNYQYRENGETDPNINSDRAWTQMHKREVNG